MGFAPLHTDHQRFSPSPSPPHSAAPNAGIEKSVRDARHRLWQVIPSFPDLEAPNDWLEELSKRVSPTCLITFDRNRYSVPASFANRPVSMHAYPDRLVIVVEGHVICTHGRIIERSHRPRRVIYDWRHYLAVVQRKPGALRNRAPFVEMPDAFRKLQDQMLRKPGGDREMVDILSLVLHHDEQAVLCAVEMALDTGVPTKTHVLSRPRAPWEDQHSSMACDRPESAPRPLPNRIADRPAPRTDANIFIAALRAELARQKEASHG